MYVCWDELYPLKPINKDVPNSRCFALIGGRHRRRGEGLTVGRVMVSAVVLQGNAALAVDRLKHGHQSKDTWKEEGGRKEV